MQIDVKVKPQEIIEHLLLPYCSFIRDAIKIDLAGNSVVYCSQWFPIMEAITKCFPNEKVEDIKLGLNFVQIQGNLPEGEELHVHISFLVGLVVEGSGIIIYKKEKDGEELREKVNAGDMVFVPRNTLHYFEGSPVIRYSALEFGPTIDYQKHHHEEIC